MKSFFIGNIEIKVPVIQGGMGVGISLSGLASAVANEGGVGVIQKLQYHSLPCASFYAYLRDHTTTKLNQKRTLPIYSTPNLMNRQLI